MRTYKLRLMIDDVRAPGGDRMVRAFNDAAAIKTVEAVAKNYPPPGNAALKFHLLVLTESERLVKDINLADFYPVLN